MSPETTVQFDAPFSISVRPRLGHRSGGRVGRQPVGGSHRDGVAKKSQAPSIHHGSLVIDLEAREVRIDDVAVALTPQEFRLLVALARRPNRTQSLAQLLDHAWDDPFAVNADRVKYAVMRLRRKLTDAAQGDFDPIATVCGIGYRFELAD